MDCDYVGIDYSPSLVKKHIKILNNSVLISEAKNIPFKDNYFDWIYVDGDHSYEFVKKDLELFFPKVKSGGYITGDDYVWWGPFLGFGVKKAIDQFLGAGLVEKVSIKNGQYILRKL